MRIVILLLVAAATAFADPSPDQLAKDRADAAAKIYPQAVDRWKVGRATVENPCEWSIRWLDAGLAVPKANTKQALADHVQRMTDLETAAKDAANKGTVPTSDVAIVTYYRTEAQLWAARGHR